MTSTNSKINVTTSPQGSGCTTRSPTTSGVAGDAARAYGPAWPGGWGGMNVVIQDRYALGRAFASSL